MKTGISVNLLAYNEAENLRNLLPEIRGAMEKLNVEYEISVIDTEMATDDTQDVCNDNNVNYINQEEPKFGGAFRTAIKYADRELFLILDSDGAHPPQQIPEMYETFMTSDADVVIGSRYVQGGGTHDAMSAQIMSRILNFAFRVVLGIRAKDLSTNYRLYHTSALKRINLTCINYDILEETMLLLKLDKKPQKFRVKEIPITLRQRKFGESKRTLIPFIISYIKTLFRLLIIRIKGNKYQRRA